VAAVKFMNAHPECRSSNTSDMRWAASTGQADALTGISEKLGR
jgi:hypothetical protein